MSKSYTAQEVADLLGQSISSVYAYERKGVIEREEDPHHLRGNVHYPKETVDQLIEEKKRLDNTGISIADLSKKAGIFAGKIRKAIQELNLDVKMVQSNPHSNKMRFALTPEQEMQILEHLNRQKPTRAKRNHLYLPSVDLALYQSFLIAGEQQVRLKENEQNEIGFQLDSETFVSYVNAIRKLDIEPRYSIHKERMRSQQGFTDLVIPTGKKAFYQILDALYSICGVENFNADIQKGELLVSVRNAQYLSNYPQHPALETMQQYVISGEIEVSPGVWHFNRTEKTLQIQVNTADYSVLKKEALQTGHSFKGWIEKILADKAQELKNK